MSNENHIFRAASPKATNLIDQALNLIDQVFAELPENDILNMQDTTYRTTSWTERSYGSRMSQKDLADFLKQKIDACIKNGGKITLGLEEYTTEYLVNLKADVDTRKKHWQRVVDSTNQHMARQI